MKNPLGSRQKKPVDGEALVVTSAVIETWLYEQLKKRALSEGIPLDEALVNALRRGIHDYLLYVMEDYRKDYELIGPLFNQYKQDNDRFKGLEAQNELLEKLLSTEIKL